MEFRIAVLDLYDGHANEGMRCIKMLIENFYKSVGLKPKYEVFDVRGAEKLPSLNNFDAFISSGGPGSPLLVNNNWEKLYFEFLEKLIEYNNTSEQKKHLLAICHSFQMVFQYFDLGEITKRKSTSFGIMPIHKTSEGNLDAIFEGLEDPFWSVDSRDFQALQPNQENFERQGCKILCIEKERPHIPLERAIMAVRFTNEIIGTQFHPEADAEGMERLFKTEEKRNAVIESYGEDKYFEMIAGLQDPDKILLTENTLIPNFLKIASAQYFLEPINIY